MKIKLLVAAAATVMAGSVMAQSAFEGFYGQIATGYENNSASDLNGTLTDPDGTKTNFNASNQSFGGAPIVIGLGYNFTLAPQWLLGLGVDYSALSQTSSTYSSAFANGTAGAQVNGQTLKISNRVNVFITPGYAIDKDKLVYLKAGYSSVQAKGSGATSYTQPGYTEQLNSSSTTQNLNGYIVGLGYKQVITGGVYGFAEGNYMSYSKSNSSGNVGSSTYNTNSSLNTYQLLVGVGYKF